MDYTNWMQKCLPLIRDRPLREISMPASHDSGMSVPADCGVGSNVCNTKTQTRDVLGQLQAGIRYFDLRPAIYQRAYYTAHLDDGTGLGCNGQSLQRVLSEVASFIGRSGDLVILKFSHYYDRDAGRNSFTYQQMQGLINTVSAALQRMLFTGQVTAGRGELCALTVNDYIGERGTVLTVYDKLDDALRNPRTGVYAYADAPKHAGDLNVYDHYSNTNDLSTMVSDQLAKLEDPENHKGNLFLLSWTLTLSKAQAIAECQATPKTPMILNYARTANRVLRQNMEDALNARKINSTICPNLLYTDDCDTTITDTAIWINKRLHG